VAIHRSKSVVERNIPRWFRVPNFKAWDDFMAFFKEGGVGEDAALKQDYADLESKGDDAPPKALGRLLKAYNKGRRFKHTEVAPPWYFVEGVSGKTLPKDDAWTIDLANELDHERSQKGQAPRPTRREKKESAEAPKATDAAAAAPAPEPEPAEPPAVGVVPPPATDKTWTEALRRLPGKIQLLVDGRGVNASDLNERRRRALDLAQIDRIHNLAQKGGELRRNILEWALEKKRSAEEVAAELQKHKDQIESWVKDQLKLALARAQSLDEHARGELATRIRKLYPKVPDENALKRLVQQALDASAPKRLGAWAKKVIDDFNNSRGSAAEKVRDPRIIDGLVLWLTQRRERDTPTDGEIYEQIQRLGGPNMAAKKRRQEGPRPPKQEQRKSQKELEAEADEKAALAEARAAERAARQAVAKPAKPATPPPPAEVPPPPPPPPPAEAPTS